MKYVTLERKNKFSLSVFVMNLEWDYLLWIWDRTINIINYGVTTNGYFRS